MDVNSFMEQSLANQARHTSLLEGILDVLKDINDNGVAVANQVSIVLPEGMDVKAVGNVMHAQPADKVTGAGVTSKAAVEKQAVQETQAVAETVVQETKVEAPKEDKKKVSIDDARAALKKYAAIEGNDAAMELLSSLGAASVSALAEQGGDALQKLIDKCNGKAD